MCNMPLSSSSRILLAGWFGETLRLNVIILRSVTEQKVVNDFTLINPSCSSDGKEKYLLKQCLLSCYLFVTNF